MDFIHTKKAPRAIGPYNQGMITGDTLYVSGQTPLIPQTMKLVSLDIKTQTEQCLLNIQAIVEKAGFKKEHIVKCGIFLIDFNQINQVNEVFSTFFSNHKPSCFTVEVCRLPMDASIEIDAIAYNGTKEKSCTHV